MEIAATIDFYDRTSDLKAFDDTKAGVKGLVDAGITQVPRIFSINPPHCNSENLNPTINKPNPQIHLPIIDLQGAGTDATKHKVIVEKIREASETWGFFQVVNHGIPIEVMEEMINGVRRFFEQDIEEKKQWYSRDTKKLVRYNSNFDLFSSPVANWRDTIIFNLLPQSPKPEEIPETCRDILIGYSKQVLELGSLLLRLFSEALGLHPSYLEHNIDDGLNILGHYYPPCPQPEKAIATNNHADNGFFTILLQDNIGGLQILHKNQWLNVPPIPGALVVNIGDLLQLMTNDKFVSAEHRVLANNAGPRVSVACFRGALEYPSLINFIKHFVCPCKMNINNNCNLLIYTPISQVLPVNYMLFYKNLSGNSVAHASKG